MAEPSPSRGPSRETRLLLLTLLVSVAVLFVLARFRFPERPLTDLSPPQPLSRLTRGLAFDELSGSLAELLRRFDASVVILRVAGTGGAGADSGQRLTGTAATGSTGSGQAETGRVWLVPALRVRDDLALAPLAPGDRPMGVIGAQAGLPTALGAGGDASAAGGDNGAGPRNGNGDDGGGGAGSGATTTAAATRAATGANAAVSANSAEIATSRATADGAAEDGAAAAAAGDRLPANALIARDELRGLAMVRVPRRTAPALSASPQNEPLDVPGYVAVLEVSPAGPTIRAEFVSSLARTTRQGWDTPVLLIGGIAHAQRGALLLSLTGRFVGTVLDDLGRAAVVAPADAVMAQVDRLARGESLRLARPGFDVQPLTMSLARATGATAGVVVSAMAAPGPDGPPLHLGDVIAAADGQPVRSLIDWQRALVRAAARLSGLDANPVGPNTGGQSSTAGGGRTDGAAGAAAAGTRPGSAAAGADRRIAMKLEVVRFGKAMSIALPLTASGTGEPTAARDADGSETTGQSSGAAAGGSADAARAARPSADGSQRSTSSGQASSATPTPAPAPTTAAARAAAASAGANTSTPAAGPATLGASFRAATGGTLVITAVVPAGAAARAGLRAGDRITALLPARGPLTAARLAAIFAALPARDALVLAVDRPDGAAIVAVERP